MIHMTHSFCKDRNFSFGKYPFIRFAHISYFFNNRLWRTICSYLLISFTRFKGGGHSEKARHSQMMITKSKLNKTRLQHGEWSYLDSDFRQQSHRSGVRDVLWQNDHDFGLLSLVYLLQIIQTYISIIQSHAGAGFAVTGLISELMWSSQTVVRLVMHVDTERMNMRRLISANHVCAVGILIRQHQGEKGCLFYLSPHPSRKARHGARKRQKSVLRV